ncbi:hypothetical protein F4780DRAFT_789629 [Xylariomycetidae sp. FL0641]|nr:hypothetical protein F4780DRAFT_789629 [Xylariomycetidae sp. FL0641]
MAPTLSDKELYAITIIERVGSVFSTLGCMFIIITFASSPGFQLRPINRLVFYASFGNLMTNVASFIARQYVNEVNSFGCQFQAFLIQEFLPADALWTLAMAFNVYLTFYYKFDAAKLRKMEIWYFILCYGVPLIPSLVFIFVSSESNGRMYGDATLWCWVASKWDIFRIATFYAPVWVVILLTFFIYIRAGREIYRKRKQLHHFGGTSSGYEPDPLSTMDDPYSVKTTEVSVTTESVERGQEGIDLATLGPRTSTCTTDRGEHTAYSVTISSSKDKRRSQQGRSNPSNADVPPPLPTGRNRAGTRRRANFEANNAAWSYTKCAILFFTALLVTWIPSTANRVYSVVHVNEASIPLELASAVVLPLQGFWNAIIYAVTSWSAVKDFWSDIRSNSKPPSTPSAFPSDFKDKRPFAFKLPSRIHSRNVDSESMTELRESVKQQSSTEDIKGLER